MSLASVHQYPHHGTSGCNFPAQSSCMVDKIIYWGDGLPYRQLSGCKGDLESKDILPLMQETFRFIAGYEGDVPGASAKDCGNYLMMNLPMVRWEAAKYLHEVLENITEAQLQYPE